MPLSENDKEWVKLIAREIAFAVNKAVIIEHIKSCPHGKALLMSKWFLIGICLGPGIIGGSAGFAIAKLLAGM